MLYRVAWIFLWPILRIFFSVRGKENIPPTGPFIIVANHVYDLDPYRIGPFLPFGRVVHWLAKKELYSATGIYREYLEKLERIFNFLPKQVVRYLNWPIVIFVSFVVRHSSTIPIDRVQNGARMNRLAIKQAIELLRSEKVVGVFGEGGINRQGYAHPIFVALARKTNSPVLPVRVHNTGVVFGKAIYVNDDSRKNSTLAREIIDHIYTL